MHRLLAHSQNDLNIPRDNSKAAASGKYTMLGSKAQRFGGNLSLTHAGRSININLVARLPVKELLCSILLKTPIYGDAQDTIVSDLWIVIAEC